MWKWLALTFALAGCTLDVCPNCTANVTVKACLEVQVGDASYITCPTEASAHDATDKAPPEDATPIPDAGD